MIIFVSFTTLHIYDFTKIMKNQQNNESLNSLYEVLTYLYKKNVIM